MPSIPGAAELSPPPIPLPLEALSPPAAEAPGLWQSMVDRAKRLGAAAVAMVTLAGTLSTPVERPQPNAYETLDERRWPALPKSPTEVCPPTKPESIILADRLLAGGEDPQFTEIRRHESSWGALRNEHSDKDSYLKIRKIFKHQLAADLGLRVFDVPDQKLLEADLQREASPGPRAQKPEMPFDAYFTRTKKFLAQYGVELQIGKPGEKYTAHNTGLTQSQLERTATKQSLYSLMLFFSELPKEFVDFIGLSKIILTATEDNVPEGEVIAAGAVDMGPEPNRTMYLNVGGGSLEAGLIAHEIGHAMDAAGCGSPGAGNDPWFLALNHGETYDVKTAL